HENEIVEALWSPCSATTNFGVCELEDPDNIYGDPEALNTVGRDAFSAAYTEGANMIANVSLTGGTVDDQEDTVVNAIDQDDQAAVQAWLEEDPEIVDDMADNLKD